MNTCDGDMQGVSFRMQRNAPICDKTGGKEFGIIGYGQLANAP